jgi:hypothetical protein
MLPSATPTRAPAVVLADSSLWLASTSSPSSVTLSPMITRQGAVRLSSCLSIHSSVRLSASLSVCPFVYPSAACPACLSVCLPAHLSSCPSAARGAQHPGPMRPRPPIVRVYPSGHCLHNPARTPGAPLPNKLRLLQVQNLSDLAHCSALQHLSLSRNAIGAIGAGLAACTGLTFLELADNRCRSLMHRVYPPICLSGMPHPHSA